MLRSQNRLRHRTVGGLDPRSGRLLPSQQLRQARTTKKQTRRRRAMLRRPRRVSISPPGQRPRQGRSFKSRLSPLFCQPQRRRLRHRRRRSRRSRKPRQQRPPPKRSRSPLLTKVRRPRTQSSMAAQVRLSLLPQPLRRKATAPETTSPLEPNNRFG